MRVTDVYAYAVVINEMTVRWQSMMRINWCWCLRLCPCDVRCSIARAGEGLAPYMARVLEYHELVHPCIGVSPHASRMHAFAHNKRGQQVHRAVR